MQRFQALTFITGLVTTQSFGIFSASRFFRTLGLCEEKNNDTSSFVDDKISCCRHPDIKYCSKALINPSYLGRSSMILPGGIEVAFAGL